MSRGVSGNLRCCLFWFGPFCGLGRERRRDEGGLVGRGLGFRWRAFPSLFRLPHQGLRVGHNRLGCVLRLLDPVGIRPFHGTLGRAGKGCGLGGRSPSALFDDKV